jgi:ribose transport system substrate-binding protein
VLKATVAVFAVAALIAACGDDGNGNGNGAAGGDETASPQNGEGGSSDEVAAAQEKVEEFKQEPTSIRVDTPLDEAPEPGGTFVWLKCDVGQCVQQGEGIEAATEAIGWEYREINYQSADPATLVSGLQEALRLNPTAVALSGLPRAVWESAATAYSEAGVPIVIGYVGGGDNVGDPIIGEVGGDADVQEYGEMIGNWFIADSDAQGNAVLLSVNDFPVLKTFSDSFKETVEEGCSECSVTEVNATIPQVFAGQTVPPLISAIQRDPSIDYVITSNMPFISGITGQLSAAGLEGRVRIAGESADVEGLQLLQNGTYHATTGLALRYNGWLMVDMALRHLQGMDIPADGGGLPKQLLTQDVDFEINESYDKPADFAEQFKALWNVA